jgi:hypothetical protein
VPSEPLLLEPDEPDPLTGEFIKHVEFVATPLNQLITTGVEHVFNYDHDFVSIKRSFRPEFLNPFKQAQRNYAEGDWINAQSALSNAMVY